MSSEVITVNPWTGDALLARRRQLQGSPTAVPWPQQLLDKLPCILSLGGSGPQQCSSGEIEQRLSTLHKQISKKKAYGRIRQPNITAPLAAWDSASHTFTNSDVSEPVTEHQASSQLLQPPMVATQAKQIAELQHNLAQLQAEHSQLQADHNALLEQLQVSSNSIAMLLALTACVAS